MERKTTMTNVLLRPRVSCSTATSYHLPLAIALRMIRDAGCDGAEVVLGPETIFRGMSALAQTTAHVGLPILSVHPPLYRFPGWPRDYREAMRQVVDATGRLGAEVAVIHAPKSRTLASPRARRYVAALDAACALAQGQGNVIGLETTQRPLSGKPPMLFDDLPFFLDFVDQHSLAVTLDTSHAGANGEELAATLAAIGPRLRNIHFSDVTVLDTLRKPQTHRMPGSGNRVDLANFVQRLAQAGYQGVFTLELAPGEVGLWPPRTIIRRLRQARDFIVDAWDSVAPIARSTLLTP